MSLLVAVAITISANNKSGEALKTLWVCSVLGFRVLEIKKYNLKSLLASGTNKIKTRVTLTARAQELKLQWR
jgi:hypothetical protein